MRPTWTPRLPGLPLLHPGRFVSALQVILLAALFSGCAQQPTTLTANTHLPSRAQIDGLPFFPQLEDQCGPASLATVLSANGVDVTPEQLRDKVYIPDKQGSLTTEMIARARRYGMLAYPVSPDLATLLGEVAAGHPVLVLQNLSFSLMPRWHFSVITGYNLDDATIIERSGDQQQMVTPVSLFEKTWGRADRWAYVVLPSTQLPADVSVDTLMSAASDLEQVGETEAAYNVYTSTINQWPEQAPAYFGQGNSAFGSGRYQQAIAAFSRYLELQPHAASGWNNLAYSLMMNNCAAEAVIAVECALELAPEDDNIAHSAAEISLHPGQQSGAGQCAIPECPAVF